MTFSPITISDSLFTKVARYFPTFDCVAIELIQNAYRATLAQGSKANIQIHVADTGDGTFRVSCADNGGGIDDFGRMLSLATSDWDKTVQATMDPAGMGVCALLAAAESVTWVTCTASDSQKGTVRSVGVDSKSYFNDAGYRASLAEQSELDVVPGRPHGTVVTLYGVRAANMTVIRGALTRAAAWIDGPVIVINGSRVEAGINEVRRVSERLQLEPGVDIYLLPSTSEALRDERSYTKGSAVLWHGCLVRTNDNYETEEWRFDSEDMPGAVQKWIGPGPYISSLGAQSYLVVGDPAKLPITPKLPDRSAVVADERTLAFLKRVRRAVQAHLMTKLVTRLVALREAYDGGADGVSVATPEGLAPAMVTHLTRAIYRVEKCRELTLELDGKDGEYHHPAVYYDPADCDFMLTKDAGICTNEDYLVVDTNDGGVGMVVEGLDPEKIIVSSPHGSTFPIVLIDSDATIGKKMSFFMEQEGVDIALVPDEDREDALDMDLKELRANYPVVRVKAVGFWTGEFTHRVSQSLMLVGTKKDCTDISEQFATNATGSRAYDSCDDSDISRTEYEKERSREFAQFWHQYGGKLDLSMIYDAISETLGVDLTNKHLVIDKQHIRLCANGSSDTEKSWPR